MARVKNPFTNAVMSVRGANSFWVVDPNTGQKSKFLIEDYKLDKGVKPAPENKVVPEVKTPAEGAPAPEVKPAPEAAPGAQQVVVKQPDVKPTPEQNPNGVVPNKSGGKPAEKSAGSVLDEWWF
jgi:hypothetical protein